MTATSLPRGLGEPARDEAAAGRGARLAASVRSLRTKVDAQNLERALLIIGGLLMPLGVLLIILGWVGAAHTALAFEQNDYLISGGILGLALVVAGGFVYFAYWQTVRIRESRHQSSEIASALSRLELLLRDRPALEAGVAAALPQLFVATPTGSMFHRRDCPTVVNRDDLRPVEATTTSLRPCRICAPLDE